DGVGILHAGTKKACGHLVTNGGRVLNIVSQADSLEMALNQAYAAAESITFDGRSPVFRRDIGQTALLGY
ncbi:MAG: phosphoribosylglycinamide synthetase C domain-containing protein, partial [Candidatus Saccharimonadales bacterium]